MDAFPFLIAAAATESPGVDWKQIAIIVALLIPSMKTKLDHSLVIVWLMRIAAGLIAISVLNDFIGRSYVGWIVPSFPKQAWDYILPVVYVLLYAYFVTSSRRISNMQARALADDKTWSANPFRYLYVAPDKCDINLDLRTVTLVINVKNEYDKSRMVWVSANVAVYREGASSPLFTLPLPVVAVSATAGGITAASPIWSAVMEPGQAAEARAVFERDRKLLVRLVDTRLTTLANLVTDPRAISDTPSPNLTPIEVRNVHYE